MGAPRVAGRPPRRSHTQVAPGSETEALIDALLDSQQTYEKIVETVKLQTGVTISTSWISRRFQRLMQERLREDMIGREVEALTSLLSAKPELDLRQGAKALVLRKIVRSLAHADANFEKAGALAISNLLLKLDRSEQYQEQNQIQRDRLTLMRQRAEEAAQQTKAVLDGAGVSPEQVATLVEAILGVTAT